MEPLEIHGKRFDYKGTIGADWEVGPVHVWHYYQAPFGPPGHSYYVLYHTWRGAPVWAVATHLPQYEAELPPDCYMDLGDLVQYESNAASGLLWPLTHDDPATPTPPTLEQFVELRKRLGWSARDVSLRLRLHETYVSRIERGEREWRPVYYYALLGLSVTRRAE